MSRVQIKVDELEAFAKQIVKAEQECDHALRAINLHFNSLLANFPGAVPDHIHNLEADFKYSVKRYKSKLDDAQRLIKLTAAKMAEADRKMSGKAGNFLLELLGWYDLLRLTGEYDPVTGEKLSAGDKTLAAIMLGLSIFPPAKAVGVGGKVAVAGTKAGKAGSKVDFPMFAKDPKVFMSIKNVLDTGKVRPAFKKVYDDVVVGPLAATKVWFDKVVKRIGDLPIPMNLQVQLAGVGAYRTTVREAFQEAKEQISGIVAGKSDEVGKGTGKYQVGAYKDIKGVEGLDAHHAGQKAAMKKLVDNYDLNTAPAINVPKVGHTIKGPNGIVSRSTKGIDNPRQLLARDIRELRRVYNDIPNSALKELIVLNKKMYPEMRK
ncbi:pre-toxin TG domain-containing protein [Bacillus sp. REN3]|uniref:pre-toxin TG domain-containing protein n=1 Tax=Bacillus sp. REN3 TaxID=2802440 RepID=UPI001AEEA64C|nr:pre-toxin TG domain-containing protein [Bacillus sp. REN3]